MGLFLFGLLVFPKVFRKPKKPSGKPNIPKKTKEHQKNIWENQKNKVFKGVIPTLGYGFGLFLCCLFYLLLPAFEETKKPSGKPTKQTRPNKYPRVGLKPWKQNVVGFPKVFCVFFGFILYCWFSLMFFRFSKNLRENQKNKKKTYSRVGLKPLKCLFLLVVPKFCWFSLIFFDMFGFP